MGELPAWMMPVDYQIENYSVEPILGSEGSLPAVAT